MTSPYLRFNPLSYGSPVHAFWAESPGMIGTANGVDVTSWENTGSNGTAATEATNPPSYVVSGINGRPSLDFVPNDKLSIGSGDTSDIAQPGTIVCVMQLDVLTNVQYSSPVTNKEWYLKAKVSGGAHWRINAGTNLTATTDAPVSGTPYVTVAVYDGTSSHISVNGVEINRGDAGTDPLDGLIIGSGRTGDNHDGDISFIAVYDTDVTGESWFAEFEQGLRNYYGTG